MISIDIGTVIGICALLLSLVALGALLIVNRSLAHWRGRCLALEASLPALRREVELRAPAKSLGEAIDSARRGAEPAKLTRQFGLSRGEAELVARMHGHAVGT